MAMLNNQMVSDSWELSWFATGLIGIYGRYTYIAGPPATLRLCLGGQSILVMVINLGFTVRNKNKTGD